MLAGAPWPGLGALGAGAEGLGALGATTRGISENYLRNFFFEKFGQKPTSKKGQKVPVDTDNLRFKLKITDMMGTTIGSKSGKIGKATRSISIPTRNLEKSKGTNSMIQENSTPFQKKYKRLQK